MRKSVPIQEEKRWQRLKDFVRDWHRPLSDEDGESPDEIQRAEQRLGFPLPEALREWYRLAGRRTDLTSMHNRLILPSELQLREDVLVVYEENQAVAAWGIHVTAPATLDPPIQVNLDYAMHPVGDNWIRENDKLSEFIFQMLVLETVITSMLNAWSQINATHLVTIQKYFPFLGFPVWHWPEYPTCFFGSALVLIVITGNQEVWMASRDEGAFAHTKYLIGIDPE